MRQCFARTIASVPTVAWLRVIWKVNSARHRFAPAEGH
jgi:hypothetical protein